MPKAAELARSQLRIDSCKNRFCNNQGAVWPNRDAHRLAILLMPNRSVNRVTDSLVYMRLSIGFTMECPGNAVRVYGRVELVDVSAEEITSTYKSPRTQARKYTVC